jgi:ATP-dependent Clp protease protease subunit
MFKDSAIIAAPNTMKIPIQAVQSTYYGNTTYRTPPPDLPSLLLNERIVYLGMPLVPAVTELIIAELLYLQYQDPDKPIRIYINSTGTSHYNGEPVGFETEAFAICDTMNYIKPPIHTICLGSAMGMAAMLLSAGTKGSRAS